MDQRDRLGNKGIPTSLLKKLLIASLALTTGCTNTVLQMEHSSAVEQPCTTAYCYNIAPTAETPQAPSRLRSVNGYYLTDLGDAAPIEEPPSRERPLLKPQAPSGLKSVNGYSLSELGGLASKEGPPSREKPLLKSQAPSGQKTVHGYNLPELGGAPVAQQPTERSSNQLLEGSAAPSEQQLVANPLNAGYKDGADFQSMAAGMLNSAASSGVKEWFSSRHATAELSMSTGERGARSGSFDVLYPIFDDKTDLVFTQVGLRRSNAHTEGYRNTVNLGIGLRHSFDSWMAGFNSFYDRDMTGKNDRLGVGAEVFTDNVRSSANFYYRLSDWKKSPDLEDYLERPATGLDLRVEANLPSHPQLGGKIVYEKYYGDQVALFGASNRQKDPQAVTVGVSYNPVPMIGFGVDYRQGQGGLSETTGKMSVNYQFGVPLEKQLSLAYSQNHRLENSRYGLVDRNNEIVLDYREKDAGQIIVPALVHGSPATTISFPVTLTDRNIRNFTWAGSAASFALPYGGGASATVVLPAYNTLGGNLYTLQAIGSDRLGRVIQSNLMQVRVDAFLIGLERSKATGLANGTDEVTFTAKLQEPNGDPKQNTAVTWDVTGNATVTEQDAKTDAKGTARLKVVSRFASTIAVSVREPQGAQADSSANFSGDVGSARVISLVASPEVISGDNVATTTLLATVEDANGNSLPAGVKVDWKTTLGTLSATSSVTDEHSQTIVTLKGKATGAASVTAAAVKGESSAKVTFAADNATAKVVGLTATPASILANGVATSSLVATVDDVNGNPVANAPVTWTTTTGTLSASTTVTDANGKTSVTLKGMVAGSANVKAQAAAGAMTAAVALTADASTAKVVGLTATPASIIANGIDSSVLEATVEDANGNLVANAPVTWSTTTGALSASSTTTDANGKTSVTLKGAAAGSASVKAQAVAGAATAVVALSSDGSTAKVVGLTATPASILANGVATSLLVASVKDANGNAVANAPVTWSTTTGTLSASTTTTDANGKTSVTLKGTAAGSATVQAQAAAGAMTAAVALIADGSTAKVVALTATPASIIANGAATSLLVATVKDANGNPVANAPVTWSTTTGALSASSTTTDASGQTSVTLKGTAAGSATVQAQAAAGAMTAAVALIADGSTAKVVGLTATPTSIIANGVATSVLVATVEDAQGNPVANAPVTWSTTTGTLSGSSTTTDANGQTSVTLKGTAAGSASVKAQAAAGALTAAVALTADGSTAKVVGLTATPASIIANGVATSVLLATVEDANGNPVANAPVTWSTTTGTLSASSTTTDASGKTSVTLKGTSAGSATVQAQAAAGAMTAAVALTADGSTAKVVALTATPASIIANGVATSSLVATVKDANGNPVANAPVTWSTTTGNLSASSTTTDASGKTSVTLKGTEAGSATVQAQAAAGAMTAAVALTADGSTAKVVGLTATPASIIANGVATSVLLATVEDANGNPVANAPVTWSTTTGTLSASSTTTDASGKTSVTLKGTSAGSASVKAQAAAGAMTAAVALTADSSTAKVVGLTATPASIIANGVDTSSLTATVEDVNGNPVANAPVIWTTSTGTLSATSTTTDANGKTSITLKGTTAGSATVQAQAAAGAMTATVTLSADVTTANVVSLVATPSTIQANVEYGIEVVATLKDAFGNAIPAGVRVDWSATGGDIANSFSLTDATGKATTRFGGNQAGNYTITASASGGSANTVVAVTANTSQAKVISVVATPTTIVANGVATTSLVASVEDGNGNPVANAPVTWSTSTGTTLTNVVAVTDSFGKATATLSGTKAGTATVKASSTAGFSTGNVQLIADVTTPKFSSLVATPSTIVGNNVGTSTLVATITDANNNPLGAGVVVNWTTTLGDLSGATSLTDASGKATITLTSKWTGTASVKGTTTYSTLTANVSVTPDPATLTIKTFTASPLSVLANGVSYATLVAKIVDVNGDPAVGARIVFSTNMGTLSATTVYTDATGTATAQLSSTVTGVAYPQVNVPAGYTSANVFFN